MILIVIFLQDLIVILLLVESSLILLSIITLLLISIIARRLSTRYTLITNFEVTGLLSNILLIYTRIVICSLVLYTVFSNLRTRISNGSFKILTSSNISKSLFRSIRVIE